MRCDALARRNPSPDWRLSPSGDRALVARHVPQNVADQDIWLVNVARDANPEKLTFAAELEFWPAWLTNDRFAYGAGGGERNIYEQDVASRERLVWFGRRAAASPSPARDVWRCSSAWRPGSGVDLFLWARTENGPPNGGRLMARGRQSSRSCRPMVGSWRSFQNETGRTEIFIVPLR